MKRHLIAMLGLIGTPAWAQQAPVPVPTPVEAVSDEIVVTGRTAAYQLDGKRLRAAQRAFAADRDRFAPAATLRFEVLRKNTKPLDGLMFELRRGTQSIAVPVDAAGRFVLPPLDSDDWLLIANRAPGDIGVHPLVFSPGSSEADARLGDLRLSCRVSWALRRDQFSFIQRSGFEMLGGCGSNRIAIYLRPARPVSSAELTGLGAPRPLPLGPNGVSFQPPLADEAVPNDARVRLVYR